MGKIVKTVESSQKNETTFFYTLTEICAGNLQKTFDMIIFCMKIVLYQKRNIIHDLLLFKKRII